MYFLHFYCLPTFLKNRGVLSIKTLLKMVLSLKKYFVLTITITISVFGFDLPSKYVMATARLNLKFNNY